MNLVTMEHLTKSYTERLLFDDTSFSINEGDKVGLIGINGTGKSTLLKIVAGLEEPDEGTVVKSRGLTIRYLEQNPKFHEGDTIIESIIRDNRGNASWQSTVGTGTAERLSRQATDRDGVKEEHWDLESQAKMMLTKVGIFDFDAKTGTLSGGQRKRVALVSTLMSAADLLILDEPTNHLDSDMAEWLEEFLKKFRGALLMITHDRYFLDHVTNRIVELDQGKLYGYQGGYEAFLKLKAERMDMALASERKRQSILRVELEWMQRGARARSTKQKGHIQRYEALRDQKGPEAGQEVELESVSSRLGRTTVEVDGLCKAYGDKVLLQDFTYIFLKNDRIGIIGPNGSGKSTLMKMIAGWVEPDAGRIEIGQTVKIGYFSQENEAMDESRKVIDYIRDAAEYVQTKDGSVSASQMLERFLFPGSVQYTTIGRLSGGEKRRLYLLRILMEAPNVLLLDEPTNDLDIRTLTILEDYLDSFQGIVITVSHDRYFLDRCVKRIFAFEGDGKVTRYEGGFTDYRIAYERKLLIAEDGAEKTETGKKNAGKSSGNVLQASSVLEGKKLFKDSSADFSGNTSAKPLTKPSSETRGGVRKLRFTYQEQKDWNVIEDEIAGLEEEIRNLEAGIEASSHDFMKLNQLMEEKAQKEEILEERMERWMYLNELAEKIADQQNK